MKDLVLLLIHLLTTLAKLLGPGGAKTIVADSLLMKQQLLVISRSRKRAPNLSVLDRFLLGFWSLFLSRHHIQRCAIILRPSTLLRFHEALKQREYRLLYTARKKGKPRPKGPSQELILVIVEMKQRNPGYGCPKIAEQISKLFGIDINKDIVRQILAKYYYPPPDTDGGPSWLTFIGHMKDSLWSVDLFRCESILLKTHWVLVVMDQFTRRIIGFGVHSGDVDGIVLCRMFNCAISTMGTPKYLSSDHDPLFTYHQWEAYPGCRYKHVRLRPASCVDSGVSALRTLVSALLVFVKAIEVDTREAMGIHLAIPTCKKGLPPLPGVCFIRLKLV